MEITPCARCVAFVLVDIFFLVLGLFGIRSGSKELKKKTAEKIAKKFTMKRLKYLGNLFPKLYKAIKAGEVKEAAFCIWKIFESGLAAGEFVIALKATVAKMKPWEKVKLIAVILAQAATWVASDGIAFIAEIALLVLGAVELAEDINSAINTCK